MNVSIPDGAAALGVSETKLRRTLLETAVPTMTEFRQTRTGVRKTTVLSVETLALLRAHFEAALNACPNAEPEPYPDESKRSHFSTNETDALDNTMHNDLVTEFMSGVQAPNCDEISRADGMASNNDTPTVNFAGPSPTVPITQFNALLYQHNVLREELSRVSKYVEGCDRLLGEMVKTIATLEERTRMIAPEKTRRAAKWNPFAGALQRVSASVQNAFSVRRSARGMVPATEVYYSSVLAGS